MTDDQKLVEAFATHLFKYGMKGFAASESNRLIALARIGASVAKLPREIYVATGLDDNNDQLQYGGADYKGEQS